MKEQRLDNNGWRFYPGDKVCYTEQHYEYLKEIARWPSLHIPRVVLTGVVVDADATTVTVDWNNNGDPARHLPCNIELLVSHSYFDGQG